MSETQIQLRRDQRSVWTTVNPRLDVGEVGLEMDTRQFKVGNGQHNWGSLIFANLDDLDDFLLL